MSRTHRKQPRNWHAVNAKFRSAAGDMGDKRKQESKEACRKWKKIVNKGSCYKAEPL